MYPQYHGYFDYVSGKRFLSIGLSVLIGHCERTHSLEGLIKWQHKSFFFKRSPQANLEHLGLS